MVKDILNAFLTPIRNAIHVKKVEVEVPNTRITYALANILLQEGLIREILMPSSSEERKKLSIVLRLKYSGRLKNSVLTNLKRISRPSLRIYIGYKEIPKISNNVGLVIISTSQGIITDREARYRKLGGEPICFIYL
jgi:small subunit ribosomal protein S8